MVGGGPAGLMAAVRLVRLGAEVTVLEASPCLGGQIATIQRDGWTVEAGAFLVAEPTPDVRSLLDGVGLADITVRALATARRRYVLFQGLAQPIPATLGDLISSPLLSLAGRLRMAREPFVPKRTDEGDESVDAFTRRRFGDEVAERLFDSLVTEVSGGDSSRTLIRFLFPKLLDFERTAGSVLKGQMRAGMEARRRAKGKSQAGWSCPHGLQDLTAALAGVPGIRPLCSTPVLELLPTASGCTLRTISGSETFDGVVVAVPAPAIGRLATPPECAELFERVGSVPYAPVASVSLGFPRGRVTHPLDGLSIRVPSGEGSPLLTILAPLTAFPGRVPEGHLLVTTLVGGVRHPEVVAQDDDHLLELVRGALNRVIGAVGEPVFTQVTRWPEAFPQMVVGHSERLAAATALEEIAPRIALAGSWRDGVSVSDALRGGMRAADVLARRVGLGPPELV